MDAAINWTTMGYLLRTKSGAHQLFYGGKSGCYDAQHDVAFEYAFLLWEFGVEE
jgi:protease II